VRQGEKNHPDLGGQKFFVSLEGLAGELAESLERAMRF
jgi:hypothetical protein